MRRLLPVLAALVVMCLFGLAVYSVLGTLKSTKNRSQKPTQTKALVYLPGTVYVVQGGDIYSLSNLNFTELKAPAYDWVQVAPAPGGDLLASAYFGMYSNLYLLSPQGQVLRTLLQESSSQYFENHWAYYPRVSPDGATLFYSSDWVDPGSAYNVDFQVKSVPFQDTSAYPETWSSPYLYYQGGDVQPIPLSNGGLIYVKYAVNTANGATYGQLAYVSSPDGEIDYLTTPAQDCSEPALSPTGTEIAMICTNNAEQTTTLQVASWNGTALGPATVLNTGPLDASPTWAPNGTSLLYLNTLPTDRSAPFQLWWIPKVTSRKPSAPEQVTADLNLTATSPPVWVS